VLVQESLEEGNPWGFDYMRMFDMANDSHLFLTREDLTARSGVLDGSIFVLPDGSRLLPLYEGKMIWHYDHRYGTYEGQSEKQANKGVLPHVEEHQHANPNFSILHRYWLPEKRVSEALDGRWDLGWMVAFRDVGPTERTLVTALIPRTAAGHATPQIFCKADPRQLTFLYSALASLVVDYAVRQKSSRMTLFVMKQLPVPAPPGLWTPCPWGSGTLLDFVTPRVVELSFTAQDMSPLAEDCGMPGAPFRWESSRRAVIRAELDALFFHLYGLDRSDSEWILESFSVLRKYEEKLPEKGGCGEFRTRRLVLERFDDMLKSIASQQPYVTPLEIPPGDDAARHSSG
jgi:hypothetical protein